MALPHPDNDTRIGWEDFLRFQAAYDGTERICWDQGRIVMAMTGGTERHDLTAAAIYDRLRAVYRGRLCNTFMHNRQIKTVRRSYYPDVMVRCGTPAHSLFEDDSRFIVEVISPSNTPGNRSEMLFDYQTVPSIETIVFIDTRQRAVTIHHKVGDDWTERGTRNGTFALGEVTIDMDGVWADVDDVASFD